MSILSVAIENLHALRQSQAKWDQRYAELLEELEQPDLLYLAILLHDTGKGAKTDDHVRASLDLAEAALDRLDLDALDRESVIFLVGKHLEMSAALRRDIFDPATVRAFAARVETPERLKMLCLLTYADIKAVNPEALSPWKAEKRARARFFTFARNGGHRHCERPAAAAEAECFLCRHGAPGLPRGFAPRNDGVAQLPP